MGRQNDTAPLPPSFWSTIESVPGGSALHTIWFRHLAPDLETFQHLFLRRVPGPPADAVPCPWNCGCNHKVVRFNSETLHGICQCNPQRCQTYTVVPEERVTWELDWPKLTRSLCQAFQFQHKIVKLGFYNTIQIGTYTGSAGIPAGQPGDEIPAILTLATNPTEFLNILAVLVARFGRPFILLAPSAKPLGPGAKDILSTTGSLFIPLCDHLGLQSSSSSFSSSSSILLVSLTPPSSLFADLTPSLSDPSAEELARRVCTIIDVLDSESRRKSPSLLTIFRLYCVQEMTVEQIARKCKCSKATVSNRLHLLESKTGVPAARLRHVSSYFNKFQEDLESARHDYLK